MLIQPVKIDSKIQQIIDYLVGFYQKPNFDIEYNKQTQDLPTPTKFLIKQELARLFKPYIRTIDLSRSSNYEVKEFIWQDKRFFLDAIARRIFLKEVEKFNNQYTAGVYDAVTNSDIYQTFEHQYKQEQKIKDFNVGITELGQTTRRLEERLYCAKPIKIYLKSGKELDAMTSNISRSGCLLRIKPYAAIAKDEIIKINFSALTEQFSFSEQPECFYQAKFLAPLPDKDGSQRVGVQLVEQKHEWMQFLDKYVLANRASFKVDITNAKELTESRLLEDQLLKSSQWLPIFLQVAENKVKQVKYCLTNDINASEYEFFTDHNKQNRLNSVIAKLWPNLNTQDNADNIILVAKLINGDKKQFIAATLTQLINQNLLAPFIGFTKLKGQLKVYQARCCAMPESNVEQLKLNWFSSINEADLALAPLTEINQMVSLYPLEQQSQILCGIKSTKLTKDNLSQLNQFLCLAVKNQVMGQFDANSKCARSESRYFFETQVNLSIQQQLLTAQLIDFSNQGLSVKLEKIPEYIEVYRQIVVDIPKFSQFGERNALIQAPYKIVGINNKLNTLHLQLNEADEQQPIKQFMQLLINNNRSKLSLNDQYDKFIILQRALCIAFISHYAGCAFGLAKSTKALFNVCRILTAKKKTAELNVLAELQPKVKNNQISVYPLINDDKRNPSYIRSIMNFVRHKTYIQDEIVFCMDKSKTEISKQTRAGANKHVIAQFIAKAHETNQLKTLNLAISPINTVDLDVISDNIRYISRYNKHQAEQIMQFAHQLTGIIEIVDTQQFWQHIAPLNLTPEQNEELNW